MYYIRSESSFDSAHFLKGYAGKCSNLHGHRWRVVVELQAEELIGEGQMRGMVLDFGDLKKFLGGMCDKLDHCLICESGSLRRKTIEALTEEEFRIVEVPFIYEETAAAGFPVHRVEVYETPTNYAAYE